MTDIVLLGVAPVTGAVLAEPVFASVGLRRDGRPPTCNLDTDPAFKNALFTVLDLLKRQLVEWRLVPADTRLSADIACRSELGVRELTGTSYGAPLYAALLADFFQIQPAPWLHGTGAVTADGTLAPVAEVQPKAQAAQRHGARTFLYPDTVSSPNTAAGLQLLPVGHALEAAFAWGGLPLLRAFASCITSPALFPALLERFLTAHRGPHFPTATAAELRTLYQDQAVVREAYHRHRPAWLIACLQDLSAMPAHAWEPLTRMLYPDQPGLSARGEGPALEALLQALLEDLARAATTRPLPAVRSTLALVKLWENKHDLALMLHTHQDLMHALGHVMDQAQQAAGMEDAAEVKHTLQTLGASLRILLGLAAPPEQPTAALLTQIIYQGTRLQAFEFSLPESPEKPLGRLDHPAALFDSSGGMELLTRTDFQPGDDALFGLHRARAVLPRWSANCFRFPSFVGGRPTDIYWHDGRGAWPPSIDTLHLIGTLAQLGIYGRNRHYDKVLDLGCGSGVHGILLAGNAQTEQVDFLDAEPGARALTLANVTANFEAADFHDGHTEAANLEAVTKTHTDLQKGRPAAFKEGRVRFLDCRAETLAETHTDYDLAIVTPPYVPYLDMLKSPFMWQAVAGVDLIKLVYQWGTRLAKTVVLQFSDMALAELGPRLPEGWREVAVHQVALRIPPLVPYFSHEPRAAGIREAWMARVGPYLIDTEAEPVPHHHGFRYFHNIRTYVLGDLPS